MKKEFIGYYDPSEEEISNAWSNGFFSFDTNSILNLYRYSEKTQNDFINALKTIKDKLFLPHQSGLEFHSNRLNAIESIEKAYDRLIEVLEKNFKDSLEGQINNFKKHPSIIVDNIIKIHSDFIQKVNKELDKQKKKQPQYRNNDYVLDEVTNLFENKIGKEFSKDELQKIYYEGKERYAQRIPPGFKDLELKKDKGEKHIYGDLIIWKELINFVKKNKKPLIFVTDDRKEDWWTIVKGKTIRPREELIKEFYNETEIRILIYNADNFLKFAKEKGLVPDIKDDTIKEVKEIRISDERSYVTIRDIINREQSINSYINPILSTSYRPDSIINRTILASSSHLDLVNPSIYDISNRPIISNDILYGRSLRDDIYNPRISPYSDITGITGISGMSGISGVSGLYNPSISSDNPSIQKSDKTGEEDKNDEEINH